MVTLPQLLRAGDDRRESVRVDSPDPIAILTVDLPGAIGRGDIRMQFQPQVRIADGRVTGAEALARWDHPLLGAIDADQLFAAADRAGLARDLSNHVQQLALAEAVAWPPALGAIDLSLNVTAADMAHADFAPALLRLIAATGFAPARLCVEVTESAPIADLAAAAVALQVLRDRGVRIAIDDVGAGHAGFGWLKALPLDRLKIDKSLVEDVARSQRGRALVRGIVALARAMALDVVAEGVETEAQRGVLAAEGCGWYQGFLCSAALDSAALARLVEDRA